MNQFPREFRVESLETRRLLSCAAADPTFAGGGLLSDANRPAAAHMTLLKDGRIITLGSLAGQALILTRYNSDGSADPTFGAGGVVRVAFTPADNLDCALAVQPDGKIVVAGSSAGNLAVARFTSSGAVDASFNGTGQAVFSLGALATARDLSIQADGRIVIGGNIASSRQNGIFVARCNADGSLDRAFANAGSNILWNGDTLCGMAVNRAQIVWVGYAAARATHTWQLGRLNASGQSIGAPAFQSLPAGQYDELHAVAFDGADIVVAGSRDGQAIVARFLDNGLLDSTFAGDGVAVYAPPSGTAEFFAVSVASDGSVCAAGRSLGHTGGYNALVEKLDADGFADVNFANAGVANVNLGSDTDQINAVVEQSDGRVLLAGGSFADDCMEMARFTSTRGPGGLFSNLIGVVGRSARGRNIGLQLRPNDRIVAIGDSITAQGGYLRDIESVLAGSYPSLKIGPIIRKGVGGQSASHIARRFRQDVLALKPTVVFIEAGVNDVLLNPAGCDSDAAHAEFQTAIVEMVTLAQQAGIRPVLIAPAIIGEDPASAGNASLAAYVSIEKQIARTYHCTLVNLHALFLHALAKKPADAPQQWLTFDGIHMQEMGNGLMALGILRALGVTDDKLLS